MFPPTFWPLFGTSSADSSSTAGPLKLGVWAFLFSTLFPGYFHPHPWHQLPVTNNTQIYHPDPYMHLPSNITPGISQRNPALNRSSNSWSPRPAFLPESWFSFIVPPLSPGIQHLPYSSYPTHHPILQILFPKFLAIPSSLLYLHRAHRAGSSAMASYNWYGHMTLDRSQVLARSYCRQSVFANIFNYIISLSFTSSPTAFRINIAWSSRYSGQLRHEF